MSEPAIRAAVAADRDALIELVLAEAHEAEARVLERAVVARSVDAAFAQPDLVRYWVAEAATEVVGAIAATREWSDWNAAAYWWIQFVFVVPAWRGRGVVEALFTAVEAAARADGSPELRLLVHPDNQRAIRAYGRIGFVAAPYVVMRRPL